MDGAKHNDKSKEDWERKYRKLEERHQRFLKRYDQVLQERHFYKQQAYNLGGTETGIAPSKLAKGECHVTGT